VLICGTAKDIAESPELEYDLESSIAGMSSSEGLPSESQSHSHLEQSIEQRATRMSKLTLVISHVTSKVGLLFQMSNVIRKLQLSNTSLKSTENADTHQLQSDLPRPEKRIKDISSQVKGGSASSRPKAEVATSTHVQQSQTESASALPHNESYPRKISSAIEKRQRALLW
jgi:hypothetical protein